MCFSAPLAENPFLGLTKKQRFGFPFEILGVALDFEIRRLFLDFNGRRAPLRFEAADPTSSSMELGMILLKKKGYTIKIKIIRMQQADLKKKTHPKERSKL